jgi:hypothetical protein
MPSSELWERAKPGGRSDADMQRAEARKAEANVKREGLGSHGPACDQRRRTSGDGAWAAPSRVSASEHRNYGDFTHRNPMWLVELEISPLPRVPTM